MNELVRKFNNNSLESVILRGWIQHEYLFQNIYGLFFYRRSLASLLTCQLLSQTIQDLMINAYPKMMNLERSQKHLKTYKSFLFESSHEVSSIYHSLNSPKLKFDFCLNDLAKPITNCEKYTFCLIILTVPTTLK